MTSGRVLAVVPARGGSRGLPGKNLRELGGLSLVGHALELARRSPGLTRTIVSTDDPEIEAAATALGGDVPFLRPPELARDDTPTWPVLRHALESVEREEGSYDLVAVLQPTTPFRLPEDLEQALARLADDPDADGAVSVSEARPNPATEAVVERDGRLAFLFAEAETTTRRQDARRVLVVNGLLYVFRAGFVRTADGWPGGRLVGIETPWERSLDVDEERDLLLGQALLDSGLVRLPWLVADAESQEKTSSSRASSDRGL